MNDHTNVAIYCIKFTSTELFENHKVLLHIHYHIITYNEKKRIFFNKHGEIVTRFQRDFGNKGVTNEQMFN